MGSGKRASMREGPLAALFRRTDEGREAAAPAAEPEAPAPEATEPPRRAPRRRRSACATRSPPTFRTT